MAQFFIGEWGYEHELSCPDLLTAEKAAMEHSVKEGPSAIAIWNHDDELLALVVEGKIFDKRAE